MKFPDNQAWEENMFEMFCDENGITEHTDEVEQQFQEWIDEKINDSYLVYD